MPSSDTLPADYPAFLSRLKLLIQEAQIKAALSVNQQLILLYWQIGRDILVRQGQEGWGAKVINRLSDDLRGEFPDIKGFSPRNLKYMRSFAEAWPDPEFVQQVAAQIPWFHNCVILDKLTQPADRNTIIFDELCVDYINPASKEEYKRIISNLIEEGAEGIILGCTEIPLLIQQEDVAVPIFDTTRIHAEAAVRYALNHTSA